jgi:uncharacterized protein YodC (DUF2158 family)
MTTAQSSDTVFKVGDTVKLNSDGHLMTVVSVSEDSITCAWSVRNDVKSKSFPVAALKKAQAQPPQTAEDIAAELLKARSGATKSDTGDPDEQPPKSLP